MLSLVVLAYSLPSFPQISSSDPSAQAETLSQTSDNSMHGLGGNNVSSPEVTLFPCLHLDWVSQRQVSEQDRTIHFYNYLTLLFYILTSQ